MQQKHIRLDKESMAALEELRRHGSPIPSVAEVVRRAIIETYKREIKGNGKAAPTRRKNGNGGEK